MLPHQYVGIRPGVEPVLLSYQDDFNAYSAVYGLTFTGFYARKGDIEILFRDPKPVQRADGTFVGPYVVLHSQPEGRGDHLLFLDGEIEEKYGQRITYTTLPYEAVQDTAVHVSLEYPRPKMAAAPTLRTVPISALSIPLAPAHRTFQSTWIPTDLPHIAADIATVSIPEDIAPIPVTTPPEAPTLSPVDWQERLGSIRYYITQFPHADYTAQKRLGGMAGDYTMHHPDLCSDCQHVLTCGLCGAPVASAEEWTDQYLHGSVVVTAAAAQRLETPLNAFGSEGKVVDCPTCHQHIALITPRSATDKVPDPKLFTQEVSALKGCLFIAG